MVTWLSIDEAADHLSVSTSYLYSLAQDKRIPANRVGRGWRFDREQLDAWVRANAPIEEFFSKSQAQIDENTLLRDPQREAWAAAREFFRAQGKEAILQLPVGCGKSGLISILPFDISAGRMLVIAPNLTVRDELAQVLDIANRQKCFWRKTSVLPADTLAAGPYLAVLDGEAANIHDADQAHIVLTNVQQLAGSSDRWLSRLDPNFFDLIVVDEGHHSAAMSWRRVIDHFSAAKVVHLTATPFRSDQVEVPGELIYRYSFRRAMAKGYIKKIGARYVAPDEIYFTYEGDDRRHSLQDVLSLKEEEWFSRGVALSEECNRHIVDASLDRLEHLRQSGTRHQLIAVAMSIRHAKAIRSYYAERNYEAEVIHSQLPEQDRKAVLQKLRSGLLDCIIQVQMLGEGFDHPPLSIAAIFRPFRSLAPYIQFVGRIMRVIAQNSPSHFDNQGFIVSHIGMNVDTLLEEFKKLDREDEAFLRALMEGEEPLPPADVLAGDARTRFQENMVVHREIVASFLEEDFVDGDDEFLLAEIREQVAGLGYDPDEVIEVLKKQRLDNLRSVKASEPFIVTPQRRRRELQRRLNDEVKSTAKAIINRAGLSYGGRDLAFKLFPGQATGSNFTAAIRMLNRALADRNGSSGRTRGSLSEDMLTAHLNSVSEVAEEVSNLLLERIEADAERTDTVIDR